MTDARTGSTHLVTPEAVHTARQSGRYPALCRTLVLAASLTAPTDQYCRGCLSEVPR